MAGERHLAVLGDGYRPGAKPVVVFFTGAAGNERRFVEDEYLALTAALARAGYPVVSGQFGGGYEWGNELAQQRIEELWRFAAAELDAPTDRLLGVGVSKGATALLNFARANPAAVGAVAALIPAVDVAAIHDADPRLGAEIEAAYGGPDGYREAVQRLNPAAHAPELRGVPIRCWYSEDDAIPPALIRDFARRVGAEAEAFGAAGHSIAGLEPRRVVDFFDACA